MAFENVSPPHSDKLKRLGAHSAHRRAKRSGALGAQRRVVRMGCRGKWSAEGIVIRSNQRLERAEVAALVKWLEGCCRFGKLRKKTSRFVDVFSGGTPDHVKHFIDID